MILKNISLYLLINIISKVAHLIAIPVILKTLTVESFGEYTIIFTSIIISNNLFLMGFENGINYYFHKYSGNTKFSVIHTSYVFIISIILLTCITVNIVFYNQINYLIWISAWILASTVFILTIVVNRVNLTLKNVAALELTKSLIYILSIVFLLKDTKDKLFTIIVISTISNIIPLVLINYRYIFNYKNFNFDFRILKSLFKYSYPFFIGSFLLILNTQSDKILVNILFDQYTLGLYGCSVVFGSIIILLKVAFKNAIDPIIMKMYHKDNELIYSKIKTIFIFNNLVFCLIGIVCIIFLNDLTIILGDVTYIQSTKYTPYIILNIIISTYIVFLIYPYTLNNNTKGLIKPLIIASVIYFMTILMTIKYLEIYGIILASITSNITYMCILYHSNMKINKSFIRIPCNIIIFLPYLIITILYLFTNINSYYYTFILIPIIYYNRNIIIEMYQIK